MTGKTPITGKIMRTGAVAEATRRLVNVARSEDVRRALAECAPPARRLGDAVRRAWQR